MTKRRQTMTRRRFVASTAAAVAAPMMLTRRGFAQGTSANEQLGVAWIGAGKRGPITEKLQAMFFDVVNGRNPKYARWLTHV